MLVKSNLSKNPAKSLKSEPLTSRSDHLVISSSTVPMGMSDDPGLPSAWILLGQFSLVDLFLLHHFPPLPPPTLLLGCKRPLPRLHLGLRSGGPCRDWGLFPLLQNRFCRFSCCLVLVFLWHRTAYPVASPSQHRGHCGAAIGGCGWGEEQGPGEEQGRVGPGCLLGETLGR